MASTEITTPTSDQVVPPPKDRTTPWLRLAFGVVAVLGVVVLATQAARDSEPLLLEQSFPDDYVGPVWLEFDTEDDTVHAVRLEWGRLSTTFEHRGPGHETYFFERGTAVYGRSGPLEVSIDPPVDVEFGHGPEPVGGVDIGAEPWEVEPEPSLGENRPANADRAVATGIVNEYITYGLVVEGVSVKTEPALESDLITYVFHGDHLDSDCWDEGDSVTNSNLADPSDDAAEYTSNIWFHVETPDGWGFVPDAFYSRTGNGDRMALPECSGAS